MYFKGAYAIISIWIYEWIYRVLWKPATLILRALKFLLVGLCWSWYLLRSEFHSLTWSFPFWDAFSQKLSCLLSILNDVLCNAGDLGSIPRSGRSPRQGNGNHSSTLAWRIPWTEEPGRLQSMGSQELERT